MAVDIRQRQIAELHDATDALSDAWDELKEAVARQLEGWDDPGDDDEDDLKRDWDTLLAAAAAGAFLESTAEKVEKALSGEELPPSSPAEAVAPDDEVLTYDWLFLDVRRHPPTLGGWAIPGDPTIGCSRCGRREPSFGDSPVLIANVGDAPSEWQTRTEDEWDASIGDDILAGHAALICRDCLTAGDLTRVDREWFGRFLESIGEVG